MFRKLLPVILLSISLLLIGVASYLFLHQSPEGEARQQIEESIAEQYLLDVTEQKNSTEETEETPSEEETEATSVAEIIDDNYLVRDNIMYTPDYAQGTLDCVLEIPKISLKRGVYIGTFDEINYDLDIWMTVAARPEYVLGETPYSIYGHNHPEQDLSFNRLKDVQPGDYFTLTKENDVYLYDVTDFFAEWREIVASDYVDNFSLPKENCYIFTCGRNEYRYKDICVVGTLREVVALEDWMYHRDEIVAGTFSDAPIPTASQAPAKIDTVLQAAINEEMLQITLTDANGNLLKDAEISFFDEDGITLKNEGTSMVFTAEGDHYVYPLNTLPEEGTYIVGVYKLPDSSYALPTDLELHLTKEISKVTVQTVSDTDDSTLQMRIIRIVIITVLSINLGLLIFVLIRTIREIKNDK